MDIKEVWKDFVSTSRKRKELVERKLGPNVISEDSFRMELGYKLSQIVSSFKVFAEYPCHESSSQKWDLCYFDDGRNCLEIKYMRPIPSDKNRPRTRHYGSILSDLFKLKLYSKDECNLYFVLITDKKFKKYLLRKGFPIQKEGTYEKSYDLEGVPNTAKREVERRLKGQIPEKIDLSLRLLDKDDGNDFSFYLIQVL